MSLVRVIGVGSYFGDDQIGLEVINLINKQKDIVQTSSKTLTFAYCYQPQIELLDLMRGAEIVFLVDAVKSGQEIGTIHRLENESIYEKNNRFSTHDMGVAQILQLGKVLNDLPKKIVLYGIEIDQIKGFDLSEQVLKTAKNKLLKSLIKELKETLEFLD